MVMVARQSTAEAVFLGVMMAMAAVSLLALYVTVGTMGVEESLANPRQSMAVLESASLELYHEVMAPYDIELGDHDHMALRGAGVEHGLVVAEPSEASLRGGGHGGGHGGGRGGAGRAGPGARGALRDGGAAAGGAR